MALHRGLSRQMQLALVTESINKSRNEIARNGIIRHLGFLPRMEFKILEYNYGR